MARTMVQKITDAISGSKPGFRVEDDPEVITARAAEDEAVRRAHEAEGQTGTFEAAERVADAAYDTASGGSDENAIREARKSWIGSQEAVRGHARRVKALRAAAVEARHRRERTEHEAELRCRERIFAAIRRNVAATVALVEGEGRLRALAEEREALLSEAERLSPWGSPAAARVGWVAGMGEGGKALLGGRGMPLQGPHVMNAAFLDSRGCAWDSWLAMATALGFADEK